jgi:gliding motility-associated-like protein
LLLLLCLSAPLALRATHNRAGEIHIRQVGPLTVEATIRTWTKASSVNADRDTLIICWGDGSPCQNVPRSNGNGEGIILPDDIKYNEYVIQHTYAGPATYRISMTDPNRIAGIVNVNPPSSDNVPFHIETIYTFQDPQFGGMNTTPYLTQDPIDNACVGKIFRHSPGASDPDGDSLSFQFIAPLQGLGTAVPNYSFPNQIAPGPSNSLQINPITGEIIWNAPQLAGDYNLAFIVVSWRNGAPIDTTIRDMQIFVAACQNNPPVVAPIEDRCVVAGTVVEFPVSADDPDSGDEVLLSALGGPFLPGIVSPATFAAPQEPQPPVVNGVFRWETTCEHISNQPYAVVFKALDSGTPRLADLKTVSIKVVGPAPEGVQAETGLGEVEISWDKPYVCEAAADDYFYGFSVWRREGSNPFPLDTCAPGLDGKGYTELIFATKFMQNGRYYFKDTEVQRGRTYCYRVLAKFARLSGGGYPYNIVESLPSEEVCVQLPRDLPLITNVSVEATDAANGQMLVQWSKPVAADLDTVLNPGPYRYQLLRGEGFGPGNLQEVPGASFTAQQFWQANDTIFFDNGLNTAEGPYHYQVAFYVNGQNTPLGSTNEASSVLLNVQSTDQTNNLSWQANVPWDNYRFDIFRRNAATGLFDSVGTSTVASYADRGLTNGQSYCYYVRSVGTYSIGGVVDPLFNRSQEACGTPLDTVPPCAPVLAVANLCNDGEALPPDPPYENNLRWTDPNAACGGTDDAVGYRIWFAEAEGDVLELLAAQDGATNTQYLHSLEDGLAGCYAVSALDSVGNESARSNTVCVDNCPNYALPNSFSPNQDGRNDLFTPFPGWRFVERVDFQVFNRWGNLVFNTEDPALRWDGKNGEGKDLAEGTYFYVCKVYEKRVSGVTLRKDVLSGYIELIRGGR